MNLYIVIILFILLRKSYKSNSKYCLTPHFAFRSNNLPVPTIITDALLGIIISLISRTWNGAEQSFGAGESGNFNAGDKLAGDSSAFSGCSSSRIRSTSRRPRRYSKYSCRQYRTVGQDDWPQGNRVTRRRPSELFRDLESCGLHDDVVIVVNFSLARRDRQAAASA